MNKKEKIYILLAIAMLLLVVTKSVYFDKEYVPQNQEEKLFLEYTSNVLEEEIGTLRQRNITTYKIVKIKKIEEEGESTIDKYDENGNKNKEIRISGRYRAKIRKYIFGIFPYGEFSVLSRI